jgi:hypothetical protein
LTRAKLVIPGALKQAIVLMRYPLTTQLRRITMLPISRPSHVRDFKLGWLMLFVISAAMMVLISPLSTAAQSPVAPASQSYPEKAPTDAFQAQLIPRNSKVFIAPMKSEDPNKPTAEGFEGYIAAALRKKSVPLIIVADRGQADFVIEGSADKKSGGWAKKVFLGDFRNSTSASMTVTNLRTGVVAYADSSDRSSANRGLRSSAEKLAKYLKKKIENDEKKH